MSFSNSEYNLRSRLYKDFTQSMNLQRVSLIHPESILKPQTPKKKDKYASSSLLVPKITRKRKLNQSQKLPPIMFDKGSMHMSFIGNGQSMIQKNQSIFSSGIDGSIGASKFFGKNNQSSMVQGSRILPRDITDP